MPILLQGDCLEVMRDLSDHSVDCFICDLPYGCLSGGDAKGKGVERQRASGGCTWDVKIDLAAFWEQVKRLSRNDHTPVLMFCNTKFGIDLINSNPSWFRYDLVWDKGRGVSFLLANKMPMKSHEMIYVFSKKGTFYNRVDIPTDKPNWVIDRSKEKTEMSRQYGAAHSATRSIESSKDGLRCALSVIQAISSVKSGKHPTEKPISLYTWLLERYCPTGGTVLDPTAGSFNAILAAEALGFHGIGIEKDEKFFKTGCAKFADPSGNIIEIV